MVTITQSRAANYLLALRPEQVTGSELRSVGRNVDRLEVARKT